MTTSDQPSIALVGPGAIGTTVAAALHEAGRSLTICGRSKLAHLELRSEEEKQEEGERIVVPGPIQTDPSAIRQPCDIVFVAVKATQIDAIAPWLSALCNASTTVCVLQNGVEQTGLFAPYLPNSMVVPAVVWFPAQREPDATVTLRGKPRLTLPDTPESRPVVAVLQGTRCAVDVEADFVSVASRKLLQNAVAGLMALTGRRAGMFSRDDTMQLALSYARECLAVARADGAKLGDHVPEEVVNGFRRAPADMGTSILADRQAGRPLEWDIRNGVIQRLGRAHGMATPISDVVVPLLAAASDGPG